MKKLSSDLNHKKISRSISLLNRDITCTNKIKGAEVAEVAFSTFALKVCNTSKPDFAASALSDHVPIGTLMLKQTLDRKQAVSAVGVHENNLLN